MWLLQLLICKTVYPTVTAAITLYELKPFSMKVTATGGCPLVHWSSAKKPCCVDDDYHGKFYAGIKHMDGASYHKRQENLAPTRSTLKADIQTWLFKHLLQLVKAHKDKPRYIAQQVVNEHGHSLVYTPPYHPELQNIEMV
ncbi:hypothetical protein PHMEG_00039750 [Phytophthora megakarya]|uniref:Transposase n=1 Tax=Phytophthora megakarya TaxID=4795 RepID=A0A225UF00_9STRA|nr:hypothetical protein PHMEG_00039750 [Phytophthora megakarya]